MAPEDGGHMVRIEDTVCSSYLLKEKRSLRTACRQIAERHGGAVPPCGACRLADLCALTRPAKRAALPESRRRDAAPAAAEQV